MVSEMHDLSHHRGTLFFPHFATAVLLVPFPRVLERYFDPFMELGQSVKQINSKVNRMCSLGSSWSSEASSQQAQIIIKTTKTTFLH